MNKHKCPVCADSRVKSVKSIKDYPAIVFPVDDGLKDTVDTRDIIICSCDQCTHVFQVDVDLQFNSAIYTKYYEFYPFSNIECFINHYRKPFERVMTYISVETSEKELLEIGVSSESQLDYFKTLGYTTNGISPEHSDNAEIVSSFYEDYEFGKKFDCIVSRFNLEHIVDLNVFLSKVKKDLKTDGQFVVQVPNTSCFEKNKILNYYAHEHIHYFNRCSLLKLFSKHGMDVALVSGKNSPSIIAVARNSERESEYPQTYPDEIEKVRCQITNLVRQHNGRAIVYGACLSLTGLCILEILSKMLKTNF